MSTQTITKKRKSADGSMSAAKKVKVAKSADKPAPGKSALKKKTEVETAEVKTRTKAKPVVEKQEVKKAKAVVKPKKSEKKTEKIVIEDNDSDNDEENGTTLTADQTAALLAGFSSESEDDGANEDEEGIPNSKIPQAPTTGDIQDRIAAATKSLPKTSDPETTPGVIYVGRIPYGFHEPQMRAYFSQFGSMTHLKLARNRKTGKSKHFAFVEFASAAVADIVVKTMDKYLLFGHILQVRRVPAEQVGEGMWKGEGRRGWNVRPNNKIERGVLRRGRTREEWSKKVGKEERRREGKKEKLREMGYEFEMPGLKGVEAVPVKAKAVEGDDAAAVATADENAPEKQAEIGAVENGEGDGGVVVEEKTTKTKKRSAEGKPKVKEAKKAVKKIKT